MSNLIKRQKTKVKTAKGRTLSSTRWLQRHINDVYVARAQADNYRSRAAYKLPEIDAKYKILHKNMIAVDLGAAPGSWSQVLLQKHANKVIAVDLLAIDKMEGVDIIQGDFTSNDVLTQIANIAQTKVDLILSDMSPNLTGKKSLDHLQIINLLEQVLEFSQSNLKNHGNMVLKIFQGSELEHFVKSLTSCFRNRIKFYKPASSRKESAEIYLVCLDFIS